MQKRPRTAKVRGRLERKSDDQLRSARAAGSFMVVERVVPDVEGVFMGAVEGDAMGAGGVAMGVVVVPTAGGAWLAAAGAGVEGEPEVLDCAKAMPAVPRASAANAEVMKLVVFMECL